MKVKLGDVCEINPKRTPEDLSMNVSFIPMQSVSEQGDIDTSDIRSIKEVCKGFTAFVDGDVLMAKITPCMENGKGAIASGLHNGIGYGSTEFHVLRPNRDLVRSGWIYYFTKGKLFRINCEKNMTGSAGQKRVPKSYLQRYPIPLPSLAEQDKKITLLNRLRQIIILYKSQLQKLDELVKSRFIEMFGDPVKNKKGWPTMKMNTVAPAVPYADNIESEDGKFWLLNLDMVESNTGRILKKNMVSIEDIGSSTVQFSPKNVLYSKLRPYLNKVAVPGGYGYVTTEMIPLLPSEQYLNTAFFATLLRENAFLKYIETHVSGTKMPRVQMNIFWNYDVIVPPLVLQKKFSAFVRQIDKSKFAVRQALDKTQQLFDSLMQEYFG